MSEGDRNVINPWAIPQSSYMLRGPAIDSRGFVFVLTFTGNE